MTPDIEEAKRFLSIIAPDGNITFQTFDDYIKPDGKKRKDPRLCRVLHGATEENFAELVRLNQEGAGIFIMVNRGDGKGRRAENVEAVRAIFVDLDKDGQQKRERIEKLQAGGPRVIVESSAGKFHCYWLIDGELPLDTFTPLQKHFIDKFGGDPAICDLPRVLRVPGFYHKKVTPSKTRIVFDNPEAQPLPVQLLVEKGRALSASHKKNPVDNRDTLNSEFEIKTNSQGIPSWLPVALKFIDSQPYQNWLNVGMGLHDASKGGDEGLEIFINWSSTAPNFDPAACRDKWRTFGDRQEEKITLGSIYHLAQKGGWTGPQAGQNDAKSLDDEGTVRRLAALPLLEYERQRIEAADSLGVRASTLDKMVNATRKGDEADAGMIFDDLEPWPDPVNGADLLTEIAAMVRRFIICLPETAYAVALWAAMTWFMDVVQVAPLAVIMSPEKRCGKSQLLFLLGRLVYRALTASNISTAALFRTIDAWRPTILVDEADSFMKENEDLRGLLNSGHTRDGAYIIRVVGDDHEPKRFSTWGAKAIAGIGRVADTLMDRAIILELRRKLPNERVDRLRYAKPDLFQTLAEKLCRFAEDNQEAVRRARPDIPHQLNDRAQDNWEPLLAIADVAGGQWPALARATALKLSGVSDSILTVGGELLSDIREIFESKQVDRIGTAELIMCICKDDEKRWATYNRGLPIKPRQVARKLSEYGITSNTIRTGGSTVKGYRLEQFTETFSRYLDSPPSPSVTPSQPPPDGLPRVTDSDFVTEQICER